MKAIMILAFYAVFFLPIYLPFALSFSVRSHDAREIRLSLRWASALTLVVSLFGILLRHEYGNDVAGNLRGALHNILVVWGGGLLSVIACLIADTYLRSVRLMKSETNIDPTQKN